MADPEASGGDGPLSGLLVVELGVAVAGPAAAAILGDWGAEVVKLEGPTGDFQRGNAVKQYFELDNRGKRSISADLKTPGGIEVALRLIDRADVLVTNLRLSALRRLGLDYESLRRRNRGLVYGLITGYGTEGPAAGKAGYDIGAFWSRAGVGRSLMRRGGEPPVQRPAMGDHMTALALAGGIAAALTARATSGVGDFVTTSLVRNGAYFIGLDLFSELNGMNPQPGFRRTIFNPLLGCYRSSDDKWFWLLAYQGERHWPNIMRAIEREDLAADPRFANLRAMMENRRDIITVLDEAFSKRTFAEWAEIFDREDVWWDPIQNFPDVVADPVMVASNAFREVADTDMRSVASPVDFVGQPMRAFGRAPELGEHTEEVLLELGYTWPEIAALKDSGGVL
ncbi:CaiB/BaiF CoA transferase family protein [Nocardia sp. CA-120079]|uniref:CaiB/BaiF CoA transferase family protein n=1 Tax=Nocardia sp. CA-120079 TaxID=3239974 RepID=UPI003D95E64A